MPMPNSSLPPRRAVIIAVGSELLSPLRADTNSLFVTARLNELGIEVVTKLIVGDRRGDLSAAVRASLDQADLLVLTGGLGPTDDDLTRPSVADALGLALVEDPAILETIAERFARRGMAMPPVNRVQAQVPVGAAVLPNPNGTAPGLWIEHGGKTIVLLPGPPREMQPMLEAALAERLAPRAGGARLYRRLLGIAGLTESQVEQVAQPVYSTWTAWDPPISTSILAAPGQIELHLSARGASERDAAEALDRATSEMRAVLGVNLFSADGRPLEQVVGDLLRARFWRIATAESCTGGLLASRLTDIPGSSDYVDRGVVCYSNQAKIDLLDVPGETIARHGAVSEEVGAAMAEGVRDRAGAEVGVGITGIAGPGGGSEQKPVGTVVVAVAYPGGTRVRRFLFLGARAQVKFQASQAALDMVRRALEEFLPAPGA
jgi:nicotinamide-nucleotide amidase